MANPSSDASSGTSDSPSARSAAAPQKSASLGQRDSRDAAAISLPKGGGAIRGIGEKFAVSAVTGTAGLTIPLALSPGRSGFTPELELKYDSGSGNGAFGFGWKL